ncbi:hypothetical protein F5148DRAFT_1317045 [Russula earlei]|uniref:Uncharacterized protein n=1 Tax=Russula earlei TaxID=71964 RepID=A0ACC0UIU5_9AGAM|nr:hypothetical protein F5148DRAFT_1317045 [Russula earlei]
MSGGPPQHTVTYSRKRRQHPSDFSQKRSRQSPQDEKAANVIPLNDSSTPSLSTYLPSPRASKSERTASSFPRTNPTRGQSRTPTRPSSPATSAVSTPSSRSQTNRAFVAPVKSAASLPAPSPLTPLSATPLKRTSTHPMDTPTKSKHSLDPLSELLDFSPSGSRRVDSRSLQPKPSKPIAKRMLGRTRTELLMADEFSADTSLDSLASRSSSVSIGFPLSPQPSHMVDQTATDLPASQSLTPEEQLQCSNPGPSTGHIQRSGLRTYAGRSRSFLVELPTDSNPDSGVDADDLGFEVRESYKDLRQRWGVDNSEDDPHLVTSLRSSPEPENTRKGKGKGKAKVRPKAVLAPNMMNDLKSITELRSKGESRRFMDEIGYLFEGMGRDVGIGVRRGSALEIVTKLCDADFARRAKATDFRSRAWDVLRASGAGEGDKVLDAILVIFATLVAQSSNEVTELTQKADFVPILWDILASLSETDWLELVGSDANEGELKKAGIGNAEKLILIALRNVIVNKSGLVLDEERPSLRRLLSQALASLPPSVHQPSHLVVLHSALLAGLSPLIPRLSGYASGLPLLPDSFEFTRLPGVPQFDHISNCLEILDSFLLGRWATVEEQPQLSHVVINGIGQEDLAERLATLCSVCNIILRNREFIDIIQIASRCLESALRVLINVSHENTTWCELLLHQKLMIPAISSVIATSLHSPHDVIEIDESGEPGAQAFDRLCLALGLLTNLVQVDEKSKDLCRETKLDPSCPALRHCAYMCSCSNAITVLECLVSLYEQYLRAEVDDPGIYITRGHLAVLFGLLMRNSPVNQDIILDTLPGAGLRGLIQHAREFVGLYAVFMARVSHGERHDTEDSEDDLEETAPPIQVRDGATQDVTQDIIRFLEGLIDA